MLMPPTAVQSSLAYNVVTGRRGERGHVAGP